jgi:hypothetical protein
VDLFVFLSVPWLVSLVWRGTLTPGVGHRGRGRCGFAGKDENAEASVSAATVALGKGTICAGIFFGR